MSWIVLKRRLLRYRSAVLPVALALALAACADKSSRPPLVPRPVGPGFVADSPENAVRLFEWCWDHRNIDYYEALLTDDFVLACAATDSAGQFFQGSILRHFDEVETARHLFLGGGSIPPANSIRLQIDQNLIPTPDSRPGKTPEHHREIVTSFRLGIDTDQEDFEIAGAMRFFVVRGDVAILPEDLLQRGVVQPGPNRWYIERWEDESIGTALTAENEPGIPTPARAFTICMLKLLYR